MIGGNRGKSTLKLINAASEYLYNSIIRRCFRHIPEYQDNTFCLSFLFVNPKEREKRRWQDEHCEKSTSSNIKSIINMKIIDKSQLKKWQKRGVTASWRFNHGLLSPAPGRSGAAVTTAVFNSNFSLIECFSSQWNTLIRPCANPQPRLLSCQRDLAKSLSVLRRLLLRLSVCWEGSYYGLLTSTAC